MRTGKQERLLATAGVTSLALALCVLAQRSHAQDNAPLFAADEAVELTLTLPLRTLIRDRSQRPEVAGVVSYAGPDGTPTTLDVEVRTRGKSRLETCSFPPLSLNFKRGQVADTLFAGQNRLKLVTLCRDASRYQDYLVLEHLVYRIYEQVSDIAFRVRPLHVRYVDTERDGEVTEAAAFFLEHINGVAARAGMVPVEVPSIAVTELDARAVATYTLFQYVIGNTDSSITSAAEGEDCCHNTDIIGPPDDIGARIPVPYDFDQSGFVDTVYALPSEKLEIRSVTQRLYRGFCSTNDHLDETIAKFNAARPAIESLVRAARMGERARSDALDYLAASYEILNDPKRKQREILDDCRGG